ncbi:BnaC09g15110D [Brassica napus]|uniref:BnaC09g15110D protein n=1 Tax=Brassica napus TaxID=3708 RepID=A0A078GWN2_BRANA|nr:BnaC09g15110D [Brassica napus]
MDPPPLVIIDSLLWWLRRRVMAETLLSFGVEKLWDLIVRESDRFHGVKEQFDELKSDLNMLRCFLEDADAKKHASAMVRNTMKEIKEIVHDAEDIVETFLLEEELGNSCGIRNSARKFSCGVFERRGLAFSIEAISKRTSKVIRDMQSLGVQQENVKNVVSYLMEEDSVQVVSITGMGGIGKTTLAREVFNHEMIKCHFVGLAWVCVSQQFTRKYVWQTILRKLRPVCKVSEMTNDELQEKLFQVLETQKVLIVLDDIWREEDWDIIKAMFPRKKGWKVLLTSRNEGVAVRADPSCFTFKPDCLNLEESWILFRRIAFPIENTNEYKVDEEMERMGKQMIKHCGGLPLAVKVLGGLLASQYTLREWKRIHENIRSYIVGGTSFEEKNVNSVYHVLYLSFEELPIYLKHCFLYLAHFPEDYAIDVGKLSYYWAAEGIPRPRYYDGVTIQEVADGFIAELVKRNMVISERDFRTSRFETCQLHDMMREVCLHKAKEENFVHIVDLGTSTASSQSLSSRRLVIQSSHFEFHVEEYIINPKLRSFLLTHSAVLHYWMASSLCFTRLQFMRVLDLSGAKFEGGKLPPGIGKLIHLRYLSLHRAWICHLPSSIQNLKFLLYLSLDVDCRYQVYMSDFLKELRKLRYLSLPRELQDGTNVRDLHSMTRLRGLSIIFNGECTLEALSSSLGQLKHLENFNLR